MEVSGANPYAWDAARGDPEEILYVKSASVYGDFCQPTHTCVGAECGAATGVLGQAWVDCDDNYRAFPISEMR